MLSTIDDRFRYPRAFRLFPQRAERRAERWNRAVFLLASGDDRLHYQAFFFVITGVPLFFLSFFFLLLLTRLPPPLFSVHILGVYIYLASCVIYTRTLA